MKKKLTRLFSVLLAAVLVLGTLPVSAMGTDVADPPASAVDDTPAEVSAAEPEEASVVDETPDGEETQSGEVEIAEVESTEAPALEDKPYNIFFLDCGRKYYSVDSIKQLIDNASAAGFNYIQLAVGNDGLRFLLDDMSLTVGDKTYSSDEVKAKIQAGNQTYNATIKADANGHSTYTPTTNELTQSEMDTIITYANEKGMGVIPCVNTPGHMDAILYAANSLTGTTCSYNGSVRTIDVTNKTAVAFTQALLQKYITYFAGKGCQLFNMGADEYANDKYTSGSMGFGNLQDEGNYKYYVQYVNQVAAMIKTAGMNPMAFNDGIYFNYNTYSGTFDTDIIVCYWSNGWSGYTPMPASNLASMGFRMINTNGAYYWVLGKSDAQCDKTKASGFDRTAFPGDATIENPLGSMFCIWADYPGDETEASVISKTADTIAAFGARLPKDGIVISDAANNGGQLETGKTMVLTANKKVDWTTNNPSVASIAASDTGAVMAAAETATVNATAITVTAVEPGEATITAAAGGKTATYNVTVNNPGTQNVTVTVGKTVTLDPVAGKAEIQGEYDTSVVDVIADHKQTSKKDVYTKKSFESNKTQTVTLLDTADSSIKPYELPLTIEYELGFLGFYTSYYLKNGDGSYICPTRYGAEISDKTSVNVVVNSDGSVTISKTLSDITYYLTVNEDGSFGSTTTKTSLYAYEKTTTGEDRDDTTISFTGKTVGETSVTIGNVTYKINVVAEDLTKVTPLEIQYWITNDNVTGEDNAQNAQITAQSVYGSKGTLLSDLIAAQGYRTRELTSSEKKLVVFWKNTLLAGGKTDDSKAQNAKKGNDKTQSGEDFSYIRYWQGKWECAASKDSENWTDINVENDQVVAYYMQRTEVTDEVTTDIADWGPDRTTYGYANFVLLDFAVKYRSGSRTPDSFPVTGKTVAFHCDTSSSEDKTAGIVVRDSDGNWYRNLGGIRAVSSENYEVYMITLTPNKDDNSTTGKVGDYATEANSYKYGGTEKVIWVDSEDNIPEDYVRSEDLVVGGEPIVKGLKIYNQHAMLVTYYVREKIVQDALTVHYVDETDNNHEFYTYQISVKRGTTFDKGIARNTSNPNGPLTNGAVTNILNKTETVTANLTEMKQIGAAYRYANYNCTKVTRDDDTNVTLYYNFTTATSFVIDFGTPLKISLSDVNSNLINAKDNITSVEVYGQTHGTAVVNKTDWSITYTPDSRFVSDGQGESLTIHYSGPNLETGNENGVSYTVAILPASNVLYEENFLTTEENRWSNTYFANHTIAQQTQKVGDANTTYNVFGYDPNASAVGANGYWQMKDLNHKNDLGKPLTTTFYGNAFDLIGDCGKDTGRVLIAIVNEDDSTQAPQLIDVDTRYSGNTLHQVPLAHAVLGTDAHYRVDIYATKLKATTATTDTPNGAAVATYSAVEEDEFLNQVLDAYGLTMDEVDYISTATADTLNAESNDVAVYSSTRAAASTVAHEEGTHVEIDGFRVYRSTTGDVVADSYPTAEKGATYQNILDVVNGELVAAYIESGKVDKIEVVNYEEAGGPQNEIYLPAGSSVAFSVANVDEVQVSLRAVDGATQWNRHDISSNTEMYYKVEKVGNTFAIMNTGSELLAIGNVKIPAGAGETKTASEIDENVLLKNIQAIYSDGSEEPEVFTPETFTAKTTVTPVVRNKMVTLKVNVSSDVAYITVNGVKYTRTGLQGLFQKTRTIRVVNTVKKGQTKTYEVVAYNADGVASETITVTG